MSKQPERAEPKGYCSPVSSITKIIDVMPDLRRKRNPLRIRTAQYEDRHNAKRRHRYASDPEYREKMLAIGRLWKSTKRKYSLHERHRRRIQSFLFGHVADCFGLLNTEQIGNCCVYCFASDPFTIESHHIFGRKVSPTRVALCANHHRIFHRGMLDWREI